jgi:nondiscriminating aspartyl-tRNA synthetase
MKRSLVAELSGQIGSRVRLQGWLLARRDLGGIQFVLLRDRSGRVQVVGSGLSLPLPESFLEVVGRVVEQAKAPGGIEVAIEEFSVLSAASAPPPIELQKMDWLGSPESLLDYRYVSLRGLRERAALRVQAALVQAFREALIQDGFTEIFTPKLVAAGAEGGAALFEVDYFGRPAYLAQSPQLYKQIMVGVFERVFETAPVFRAEEHATSRHLNEYLSLDLEMGPVTSEEEVMAQEERVLRQICRKLADFPEEFALWDAEPPSFPVSVPRIQLAQAREQVAELTGHLPGGKDLDPEGERVLSQHVLETTGSDWVFVTRYPKAARPFYVYADEDGSTRSFDLLFRGLEVTTGGQRIHRYEQLLQSLRDRGLDEGAFAGYLEVFRHGMPPHGGLAIGAERLTAKVLGIANVRQARAFPRDRHRLSP